jgi:hypothetical protein
MPVYLQVYCLLNGIKYSLDSILDEVLDDANEGYLLRAPAQHNQ